MTRGLAPADVVVAGGGIAAAALALDLARRDLTVDLLAGIRAGLPSAPGGPVAAQATVEAVPEALADLALLSRHLFSDWLSALEEETGLPCEYDERGAMTVALDDAEEVLLDRALDAQRSRGIHFEVLEPDEARGREPALAASVQAAFSFPRDGVARAGRVGRAVVLAARAAGVRVHEGNAALGVTLSAGRVSGLETAAGHLPAESVVLADRAGPGRVGGTAHVRFAGFVRPWLRLDATRDPDRPTRLLRSRGVSLVPRRDGSILALGRPEPLPGAGCPGAGSLAALLTEVQRLVPASSGWTFVETGAGREFSAPDRLPVVGETSTPGLFVVAGWGPDELLLTPAAAAVAADLVTGQTPPLAAAPFSPGRMGA
ncbi:MAG: FAD-dependent oxidoreductase [Holophagales bacterium]|nr:FAD-dependent oxidoreductase [Holophagales bacterium]